jgi:gliding motility-associated-like protein
MRSFILGCLLLITYQSKAQINLNAGLVAYYPFNGNTLDATGNGNHATNFGATLTTDMWGNANNAYLFNGLSDYMSVVNNPTLQSSSLTLCALVKPNAFYPGLCYNNSIFDLGNGGYNSGSFSLIYTPTLNQNPTTYCFVPDSIHENYRINVNTGATNSLSCITPLNGIPYIAKNNWDCVIGIYNDTTGIASIYVNGIFRYSYSFPGGLGVSAASTLFIGGTTNPTYPYYVNGVLDELRIYNRAINVQELDSICNLVTAPADSVQASYSFLVPDHCDSTIIQFNDLSIAFNSTVTGWHWDFGDGNVSTNQNPLHNYVLSGNYTVTLIVTSNTGKADTFQTQINSTNNAPNVEAIASPTSVCVGNPTTLTGTGAITYSWTGGIMDGVPFTPVNSGSYTVTGTDANGCTGTSSVIVNVVNNLNIGVTPTSSIVCLGDSVLLTASGALSYNWLPNTYIAPNNAANPYVFPVSSTTYTVTGTDGSGCTGSATVDITVVTDPKITLTKSSDIECNIHSIQLNAAGGQSYFWQPSSAVSNPNIANPIATLNQTTTFTVTAIIGTCVITDTLSVYSYNNDETSIFIPNAFSPNNDGNNDCVHVRNVANFMNYYFGIYNRWGNLVFETDNPNDCWDGYFHNKPADVGTYYYYLKAETHCGKILKKGDITLLK